MLTLCIFGVSWPDEGHVGTADWLLLQICNFIGGFFLFMFANFCEQNVKILHMDSELDGPDICPKFEIYIRV